MIKKHLITYLREYIVQEQTYNLCSTFFWKTITTTRKKEVGDEISKLRILFFT